MKLNKAIRLAIECIRAEIKRLNFDANMFDRGLTDIPHAKKCSERRKLLYEVIETLEKFLLPEKKWQEPIPAVIYVKKADDELDIVEFSP